MLGPLWRKETDSACICLEPAFVKNGLNDQPILIPAGEIWSAVFQIGRHSYPEGFKSAGFNSVGDQNPVIEASKKV